MTDTMIAEIGFFHAAHADSADARQRARRLQDDVALAELLDRVRSAAVT